MDNLSGPTYLIQLTQWLDSRIKELGRFLRGVPWLSVPLAGLGYGMFLFLLLHQLVLWGILGDLPDRDALQRVSLPIASTVYSVDGVLLGKFYLEERIPITYEELPSHVVDALIATEDIRFFQHQGVDYQSLLRVFVKTILLDDASSGGGSTLTMQLVKNLYPRESYAIWSLLINKLREMILAERMEDIWSKPEILTHYLNAVSFAENAYGIETAAQRFFSCHVSDLTLNQAATLVGMLKAPTTYNPRLHPQAATQRRNVVLTQMERYGYLSPDSTGKLSTQPLDIQYHYADHHDGPAPYFLAHIRQELNQWIKLHPKPDGQAWNLYRDGLVIKTTLHSRIQQYAQEAVEEQMQRIQRNFERDWRGVKLSRQFQALVKRQIQQSPHQRLWIAQGRTDREIDSLMQVPKAVTVFSWDGPQVKQMSPRDSVLFHELLMQTGFMALDPHSGQVRAWVGGIDHHFFQYDHITSRRQTGSVFKPLVYAAALANGMTPCAYVPNERVVFQEYDDWTPENADHTYGGEYSLQGGLSQSVNVVAVNLLMQVGAQGVVDLATKLGVNEDVPAVPSIALGTAEASLQEMLQVYAAFVNGGHAIQSLSILSIEDAEGQSLYQGMPQLSDEPALQAETAALLTFMLRNVVNKGTARGLRTRFQLHHDIAGKTGTTQSQTDGWFIGAIPDLLAGAWVGANHPEVHFRSMMRGQGAATALPIWGSFMKRVLADPEFKGWGKATFTLPSASLRDQLDCADLWFPLAMSEFRSWWMAQKAKDSLSVELP